MSEVDAMKTRKKLRKIADDFRALFAEEAGVDVDCEVDEDFGGLCVTGRRTDVDRVRGVMLQCGLRVVHTDVEGNYALEVYA